MDALTDVVQLIGGETRIKEFLDLLEGPDGCDFREDHRGELTWHCGGGFDQTYARAALAAMGIEPAVIERFLCLCRDLGGHCDCEILFNAAEHLLGDREA